VRKIPRAAGIVPILGTGRAKTVADYGLFCRILPPDAGHARCHIVVELLICLWEGSMRYGLLVLSLAGVLVSAGPAFAQNQAAVAKGMKVFADQKCALCHSVAGKGNPKGPLEDGIAKLSADDIREWLVNAQAMRDKTGADRKPAMKSFATLPKDDLDALVAYVVSLKKK
jgi:mono/diheme cytochrome c family protein